MELIVYCSLQYLEESILGVVPKQSGAVSGLWMLKHCVHVGLSLYLLTFIGDLRFKMLLL